MSWKKNSAEFEEISLSRSRKNTPAANPEISKRVTSAHALMDDRIKIVSILVLVNLLNYMDRYTIAGVLKDIQEYYGIGDAGGGILQTVFIVAFLLCAPVAGYLGDRHNRKFIMVVGLAIWVVAVLGCVCIPPTAFWAFVLLRAVVGVGEASYVTVAPTIIADLFVKDARSKILMIFYFAIPVGSGLGYVLGSSISKYMNSWKWGVGALPTCLGIVCIVALIFFVPEPKRGHADIKYKLKSRVANVDTNGEDCSRKPAIKKDSSWIDDIKYLAKNRTYIWSIVAYTSALFVIGTLSWWAPTMLEHGLDRKNIVHLNNTSTMNSETTKNSKEYVSLIFGGIVCIGGIVGILSGTFLSQAWKSGKYCFKYFPNERADALISAIGSFLTFPFLLICFELVDKSIIATWLTIFFAIVFLSLNWAIYVDMLMYIIVPSRRSYANALQITISHLFGDASGPYIIGFISDIIRGEDNSPMAHFNSLVLAFYLPSLLLIVSSVAFFVCAYTLKADMIKAQQGDSQNVVADT